MSDYSLVYFTLDKTSFIIENDAIVGKIVIGGIVSVKWPGEPDLYEAKVMFRGTKAECEKKSSYVTKEGTLKKRFSISHSATTPSNSMPQSITTPPAPHPDKQSDEPTMSSLYSLIQSLSDKVDVCLANQEKSMQTQRELIRRFHGVENSTSERKSSEDFMRRKIDDIQTDIDGHSQQLSQILKRLPERTTTDTLDYIYVSRTDVESLRTIKTDYKKFALDLEVRIYQGEESELQQLIEKRIGSADRVDFLKKCIFKHFNIHLENREAVWRDIRHTLNSRVRRNKSTGATTPSRSRNLSSDRPSQMSTPTFNLSFNQFDNDDIYEFDANDAY